MSKLFSISIIIVALSLILISIGNAAPPQKSGAIGHIQRMIINHNSDYDEIYITTDDPNASCPAMTLRTNDSLISDTAFKMLYTYLLTAKVTDTAVDFYVGEYDCQIFRAEMQN